MIILKTRLIYCMGFFLSINLPIEVRFLFWNKNILKRWEYFHKRCTPKNNNFLRNLTTNIHTCQNMQFPPTFNAPLWAKTRKKLLNLTGKYTICQKGQSNFAFEVKKSAESLNWSFFPDFSLTAQTARCKHFEK